MINSLYNDARERMLSSQLNWATMPLVMLAYKLDPTTSFDPTDLIQSDIGTPWAVSQSMLNPIVQSGGYAKSGGAEFLTIPIGTVTFFVLAEDLPTPTPRRLLVYLSDANNLPFISNGGDYMIKPDWLFSQGWWRA